MFETRKTQLANSDTITLHGGAGSPAASTTVPIYQTSAYRYATAQELADIFAGRSPGYVYTRIANPTSLALEQRISELEGGVGCVATSSGMAAIAEVAMSLLGSGDEVVSTTGIFGGTVSLFAKTLARFGVKTVFLGDNNAGELARAINNKTRMIFAETIGNPGMDITDIAGFAAVADRANIPLVVDSTVTTPILIKPKDFGAHIVVHSTSKFINGHGNSIGGAVVDTGLYNWSKGPFGEISQLAGRAGQLAFISYLRNSVHRDLGGCAAPLNSFLMLQGLEGLGLRMERHCANALKLAEYLREQGSVAWVRYPGLYDSDQYGLAQRYLGGRGGALLTLGLGSKSRAFRLIDALKLAENAANIGDSRTLVIHPASTIFHDFSQADRAKMKVTDDMVRVSVGVENFEDIQADFEQALETLRGES